jgi:glutamine cyclotransferase
MARAQRSRRKKNKTIEQPSPSVAGARRSVRRRLDRRLLVVLACCACAWVVWAVVPEWTPPVCVGKVIRVFPHDASASTQGLVFDGGFLYEGTGQYGQSTLRKVELQTGKTLLSQRLDGRLFGEGITVWNDQIVQLTWRSGVGIVYDKSTFREIRRFRYYGEGWGLTHDGTHLIMSDGSSTLRFLDPQTYRVVRRIFVRSKGRRLGNVNELEYVDGEIFANIWHLDSIARISPKSGEVTGWIDLRHLLPGRADREACLNGIAYDAQEKRLFVTGKNWPKLFEIRLLPP